MSVQDLSFTELDSSSHYPWVYSDSSAQKTHGEHGDGFKAYDWGKIYSIYLRSSNCGVDSLTYNVTVDEAGIYKLTTRGYAMNNGEQLTYKVGEGVEKQSSTVLPNNGAFAESEIATVTLASGANTITLKLNNQTYLFDEFTLEYVGPTPG